MRSMNSGIITSICLRNFENLKWRHPLEVLLAAKMCTTTVVNNESFAPAKPVITIPVKVEERAVKRFKTVRSLAKAMDNEKLRKSTVVIAARRSELNHYKSQTYGRFDKVPLASGGWKNRKSYGDYFTINPFKKMNAKCYDSDFEVTPNFKNYGLHPDLVEALHVCGYVKPTNIQHESIGGILASPDSHNLIASETGNGKTLCLLIPMLESILNIRAAQSEQRKKRSLNSPFGVIVTPSRELAQQIGDVASDICQHLGLRVRVQLGGSIKQQILQNERDVVDIVVGSLGGLAKTFHEGLYATRDVCEIGLDEIDSLLDDTFKDNLLSFLRKFGRSAKSLMTGVRINMTGATFPTNFDNYMSSLLEVEDIQKFSTGEIHRVQFHFPHKFIRMSKSKKTDYLLQLLESDAVKRKKTLIFANKASTADFLHLFLGENNIPSINFSQKVYWSRRAHHLESFYSGQVNVMTATDLASRGLDTTQVNHVINYDFPLNPADYIHRAGRVGRVGGTTAGHVTSFVDTILGVEVLNRIEMAVRKNSEILNVNNNIIRIIEHRHKKKHGLPLNDDDN